ncbi:MULTISPECIES: hypothetical protein [Acidiphilium]|jgi:hypothetical protein|nr:MULTISPECIES: hypothetical protein [Acidiphilium]
MQRLSRGQLFGIAIVLVISTSFIAAVVYGAVFGDTQAAKHYSAVAPGEQ